MCLEIFQNAISQSLLFGEESCLNIVQMILPLIKQCKDANEIFKFMYEFACNKKRLMEMSGLRSKAIEWDEIIKSLT